MSASIDPTTVSTSDVTTLDRARQAQRLEIRGERPERGAVTFDEHTALGTARQRLDAEGAAPGEEIRDERPLEQPGTAE